MFSRRHPFLFFILMFTAMTLGGVVLLSAIFSTMFTFSGKTTTPFELGDKVGVVKIEGAIMDSGDTVAQLKAFRENPSIKAIVVRIDSPGGGVGPSQEIYREIRKSSEKKKVVASMGALAASGGYYVASAADTIMANPGTITGSIGVIMSYTNLEDLFGKIGLSPVVIKSGRYKDIASPVREMTDEERALLQAFADDLHDQFISDVAEGRGLEVEDVRKIADGRIFSGKTAKELGLIDQLGNLEDAIEMAGRLAGIKGKIVTVYPPQERNLSLLELLTGMSTADLIHQVAAERTLYGGYLYQP
jgi:protease-4